MSRNIKIQIFIIALLFTMVSGFLQVAPCVNSDFILPHIDINENLFLKIVTLFFLSYAILQIPCGFLLDSRGFRKILPISIFLVFIGTTIYSYSHNHLLIGFGRIITGAGCSSSYILTVFLATKYFKKSIIPLLIGLAEIANAIGDFVADNIYLYTINSLGLHISHLITISIIFFLFCYSLIIVMKTEEVEYTSTNSIKISAKNALQSMLKILKQPANIAVLSYSFFTWAILMGFPGYWAKNYYIHMHNYTKEYALSIPEVFWASFLISTLVIGAYTKTIQQAKKYIFALSVLGVGVYLLMVVPILFSYSFIISITILSGLSCAGITLAFFIIQYNTEPKDKALAVSINNLFIVFGAMFGQILFSYAILYDFNKIYKLSSEIHPYFYSGIIMILLWTILALISVVFILQTSKKMRPIKV